MYLCIYVYMYNRYIYIYIIQIPSYPEIPHIPSPKASAQVTQSSFWEKVTEVNRGFCETKPMGKPWENHGNMVVFHGI